MKGNLETRPGPPAWVSLGRQMPAHVAETGLEGQQGSGGLRGARSKFRGQCWPETWGGGRFPSTCRGE